MDGEEALVQLIDDDDELEVDHDSEVDKPQSGTGNPNDNIAIFFSSDCHMTDETKEDAEPQYKDAVVEGDCGSGNSWQDKTSLSGTTNGSLNEDEDRKEYNESLPSNEESFTFRPDDDRSNREDNLVEDEGISNNEDVDDKNRETDSRVKSVIKLSASMQSHMQQCKPSEEKDLESDNSTEGMKFDREQVFPNNDGYFTFPAEQTKPRMGKSAKNVDDKFLHVKITQSQLINRVRNNRVLVVSVFGRNAGIDNSGDKACIFDELMQKDVFRFKLMQESDDYESSDECNSENEDCSDYDIKHKVEEPFIEGYHDEVNSRIYLHLRGNFDSATFARTCIRGESDEKDLHSFFSEQKYVEAKLLLFLFHVSHLLVCYHEQPSMDFNYVNVFQMLDSIRAKLHSSLGNEILKKCRTIDLPKDVINHGRFCIPKLVFYFDNAPMAIRGSKGTADLIKRDGKVSKNPPIRKLEFSIEDQIFRIFRRVKLVSTTSATSCLFSIPARDGFVYVNNKGTPCRGTKMSKHKDELMDRLNRLYDTTLNRRNNATASGDDEASSDAEDSEGSMGDDNMKCDGLTWGMPYSYQYLVSNEYGRNQNSGIKNISKRSFSKFLLTHIDFLTKRAEKGSADGEERKSIYELPTSWQWYYAASCMFRLFGSSFAKLGSSDEVVSSATGFGRANSILASKTSIENRFSESRCAKALPTAVAAYKEGLQPHYLHDYHQAKLLQAVALFSHQSRGPSSKKYAELLVEECTSYWQAGRQMCEELSLTGHHCTNRKHLVPNPSQPSVGPHKISEELIASSSISKINPSNYEKPIDSTLLDDNLEKEKIKSSCDDEITILEIKLRDIFNKLTLQNFETYSPQFNELEIDSEAKLNMCIELVFEKTANEPDSSVVCAKVCETLKSKQINTTIKVQKFLKEEFIKKSFKKILITRCQKEYEQIFEELEGLNKTEFETNIAEVTLEEMRREIKEKFELNKRQAKKRALGNISLFGDLYKIKMLTTRIMHECIQKLLYNNLESREFWLECLYKLLINIGKELELEELSLTKKYEEDYSLKEYFKEMQKLIDSKTASSKTRLMFRELIDLQENNWVASHHESEVSKLLGQVLQEEGSNNASNDTSKTSSKKNLPTIPHRSTMTFTSACNCGRRQINRDDPFTLIDANFKFYAELEDDCCADLEHIQVPYYRESPPSAARNLDPVLSHSSLTSMLSSTSSLEIKTSDGGNQPSILSTTQSLNKMSITSKIPISTPSTAAEAISNSSTILQANLAVTAKSETENTDDNVKRAPDEANIKGNDDKVGLGQEVAQLETKRNPSVEIVPDNPSNSSIFPLAKGIKAAVTAVAINNENKERLQTLANRQNSSTDSVSSSIKCEAHVSIPHMITTITGSGKLPLFPSWALTQLGSSSVYAHSSGVNQSGFISHTRNLLPWDVPLKNTDWQTLQKKWPNLAESACKKSSFNPNGKGADMGLTVKVFVGLEYECSRGHRLIASSPGKTKSMTSSITNRMVNSDAPLYIECHCTIGSNTARPIVSQLMRIHVVTPKAPMHITLNPKVIPCPDGPTFHPGWISNHSGQQCDEKSSETSSTDVNQIKLPISTYWILRLPFIYWGEGGSHLPPKEVPESTYGRLLKGYIGISEDYSYKS